jgi:hypothetical protein
MPVKKRIPVRVREGTRKDVPALMELNRAAYPVLATENVVWRESHLLSHLWVFPQGQLVAEANGQILGAAASLVVDLGSDPLRPHTWAGITDSGYFTSHDCAPRRKHRVANDDLSGWSQPGHCVTRAPTVVSSQRPHRRAAAMGARPA